MTRQNDQCWDSTAFVLPGPFVRRVHQVAEDINATSATAALLWMLTSDPEGIDEECVETAIAYEKSEGGFQRLDSRR